MATRLVRFFGRSNSIPTPFVVGLSSGSHWKGKENSGIDIDIRIRIRSSKMRGSRSCGPAMSLAAMYYSTAVSTTTITSVPTVHALVAFPPSHRSRRRPLTLTCRYASKNSAKKRTRKVDDHVNEVDDALDASEFQPLQELPNEYSTTYHAPVMWEECIQGLLDCERSKERTQRQEKDIDNDNASDNASDNDNDDQDGSPLIFVDGTLGGGGHSAALLEQLQPGDILFGCDVDPNALATASQRLAAYMDHDGSTKPHFLPVQSNFGKLAQTLPQQLHPVTQEPILGSNADGGVDGVLLDLGVSSHQIDTPERGFAFMKDGPLDMRMGMDQAGGLTAADICNEFDAKELQRIFSVYGDEPRAKTIANAIADHRPLSTTGQLVDAISSVTHAFAKQKRKGRTATCARIFQSLRIVVNQEDQVLQQVLAEACPALLRPGGRLVVLSYHSMEDRATKRIMRDGTLQRVRADKDMFGNSLGPAKPFQPVGKRRTARDEEVATNTRARSASLRIADRLTKDS